MNLLDAIREAFKAMLSIFAAWLAITLAGVLFKCTAPVAPWVLALAAGLAFRAIAIAYRHERSLVTKRTGVVIATLRFISLAIVLFMLLQPVLLKTQERRIERTVAVLVDTSSSMRFDDDGWSPSEALSMAKGLGLAAGRRRPLPSLDSFASFAEELKPWLPASTQDGKAVPAAKRIAKEALSAIRALEKELSRPPFDGTTNQIVTAFAEDLAKTIEPALKAIDSASGRESAIAALDALDARIPAVRTAADGIAWDALDAAEAAAVTNAITTNRLSLAQNILESSLPSLGKDYSVRYFSMGRHALPSSPDEIFSGTEDPSQSSASDFAISLEDAIESVPSEELAGILILSDGIANGETPVEPVARRLASGGAKVSSILVGSSAPPKDLAVADIAAPESVFLGDKVRIRSRLSANGFAGETAKISLLLDGETVDETTIPVTGESFSRDFSLAFAPTNPGLARFSLKIDGLEGERFPSNNLWKVDVAVSDDRINVLLVDDYPRWDFRYLRNLFFARDKSIHLQYLLLHPDSIEDVEATNRPPAASASRPFGEAEAGSLPENEDEWRKFDAIILGDVGPDVVTGQLQRAISDCVADRGALLVAIAGPRAMPHAYPDDSILRSLLPCEYAPHDPSADYWKAPEEAFALEFTPSGRLHPVASQSASAAENEQIWQSLPNCTWRMPARTVKAGAEIIAYAKPSGAEVSPVEVTAGNAIDAMEEERDRIGRNSIIVAQNFGKGKVLVLNTDESWRLRYRTGDKLHHRFWGQVMRWGLGERLRSGTQRLRIGTERLTYTPLDPIRLVARIQDRDGNPVKNAEPIAIVRPAGNERNHDGNAERDEDAKDEETPGATDPRVNRIPLVSVEGSQGLYEATLPPIADPGAYIYEILDCGRFLDKDDSPDAVSALFFVAATRRPVEMANVAATGDVLERLAVLTGGKAVLPASASSLEGSFGEKSRSVEEILEISLWDDKWLLLALLASLTAEWILRKRGGLV